MSRKRKGINAERELIHMFHHIIGWSAVRVAGSGSSKYPSPDILAGNAIRRLAIECKTTKNNKKYLTKQEIDDLRLFSKQFGAESLVAVKFNKTPWYFLNLEDLRETPLSYMINIDIAEKKGLLFEQITTY